MRQALAELGKLRFGEMSVADALHEIVQTTHTIFDVDGAGLMLADAAYVQLRAQARSERRKLAAVSADLVRHAQHGPA